MFVEEKTQGEVIEAPAKTMKLSEAIRIGDGLIGDTRKWFLYDGCGCALGAAAWAAGYRDDSVLGNMEVTRFVRSFYGVPQAITHEVSRLHHSDGMPREKIADWVESQGY